MTSAGKPPAIGRIHELPTAPFARRKQLPPTDLHRSRAAPPDRDTVGLGRYGAVQGRRVQAGASPGVTPWVAGDGMKTAAQAVSDGFQVNGRGLPPAGLGKGYEDR